ncbi:MAG: hypothetical protein J6S67_25180 [Methanobrevibacter sp.]|nr:hypothetical protein [Methanobrevibacter sp.]
MSEIMPDKRFTEVVDGEQVVRTLTVTGDIIPEPAKDPAKYFTALVQTASGPQQVVKVYLVGGGGSSVKPQYVDVLPETGEEGVLYLVNTGVTRDGYAIFQMFIWKADASEWVAIGAFDVGINPTGIVYEQSFDASTNTWNVTVSQ